MPHIKYALSTCLVAVSFIFPDTSYSAVNEEALNKKYDPLIKIVRENDAWTPHTFKVVCDTSEQANKMGALHQEMSDLGKDYVYLIKGCREINMEFKRSFLVGTEGRAGLFFVAPYIGKDHFYWEPMK